MTRGDCRIGDKASRCF